MEIQMRFFFHAPQGVHTYKTIISDGLRYAKVRLLDALLIY